MSTQVVRVEQFTKGSLQNIGNELERAPGIDLRNPDIDSSLTHLNPDMHKPDDDPNWFKRFANILEATGATFNNKKGVCAFEGMIITADTAFFESLGWKRGEPAPEAVEEYFDVSYKWAVRFIGYKGTDVNILGAKVHYDEKTPHLQIDYVPIVESVKVKVYEKDENGKVKRNEHGSPIQKRDEKGKIVYERRNEPAVNRTEFWSQRGGKDSYAMMQDSYHENVGKKYNLGRGEKGSKAKHKTNHQKRAEDEKKLKENETKLNQQSVEIEENNKAIRESKRKANVLAAEIAEQTTAQETLTGSVQALQKQHDSLTRNIENDTRNAEKAHRECAREEAERNALINALAAENIPPRPVLPEKKDFDSWAYYHPLSDYKHGLSSGKKEQQEAYQADVIVPYENAVQEQKVWDEQYAPILSMKNELKNVKESLNQCKLDIQGKDRLLTETKAELEYANSEIHELKIQNGYLIHELTGDIPEDENPMNEIMQNMILGLDAETQERRDKIIEEIEVSEKEGNYYGYDV